MKRVITYILSCLLVFSFFIQPNSIAAKTKYKQLKVSFIDVGQGMSVLLEYKGKNVIIDTGEESEYSKLKAYLEKRKISTVHNLIITHNDSDHMGGADLLIEDFNVRKITRSKYREDKFTFQIKELDEAVEKYKVKKSYVSAGGKISIASGLKMSVLSPDEKYSDSNKNSLVIRLKHGKNSFLFTGDIDAGIENKILADNNVKSTVLQVAHHGSAYASAVLFLSKVSPKYAVINVGEDNRYGHPHDIVLKRLAHFADRIYRTDKNGNIVFSSNGRKLTVTSSKSYK